MLAISLRPGITRNLEYLLPGPLSDLNIYSKENILVEMREEAFMWPR
jgi:hypothetical protein